jgi:hypothetical protein
MIKERVSTRELLTIYRIVGRSAALDGDEIMVLERRDNVRIIAAGNAMRNQLAKLPKEIWVRGTLLEDHGKP